MSFCKFASDVTLWREFYLNTEVAAVDVVPQEQVAGCGGWSSHFKQLHKIKELPVDVSTNWKINQRTVNVTESKGFTPLSLLFVLRVRSQRHSLLTQRCWCWFWGERKQEGPSRREVHFVLEGDLLLLLLLLSYLKEVKCVCCDDLYHISKPTYNRLLLWWITMIHNLK